MRRVLLSLLAIVAGTPQSAILSGAMLTTIAFTLDGRGPDLVGSVTLIAIWVMTTVIASFCFAISADIVSLIWPIRSRETPDV